MTSREFSFRRRGNRAQGPIVNIALMLAIGMVAFFAETFAVIGLGSAGSDFPAWDLIPITLTAFGLPMLFWLRRYPRVEITLRDGEVQILTLSGRHRGRVEQVTAQDFTHVLMRKVCRVRGDDEEYHYECLLKAHGGESQDFFLRDLSLAGEAQDLTDIASILLNLPIYRENDGSVALVSEARQPQVAHLVKSAISTRSLEKPLTFGRITRLPDRDEVKYVQAPHWKWKHYSFAAMAVFWPIAVASYFYFGPPEIDDDDALWAFGAALLGGPLLFLYQKWANSESLAIENGWIKRIFQGEVSETFVKNTVVEIPLGSETHSPKISG